MENIREEFEGNILVTTSENEVRLWVCNGEGANIFRFKAVGQVHKHGGDITIISNTSKSEYIDAC